MASPFALGAASIPPDAPLLGKSHQKPAAIPSLEFLDGLFPDVGIEDPDLYFFRLVF